jgi:hypothetical protein
MSDRRNLFSESVPVCLAYCCWSSPAQSFVLSPSGLMIKFYFFRTVRIFVWNKMNLMYTASTLTRLQELIYKSVMVARDNSSVVKIAWYFIRKNIIL